MKQLIIYVPGLGDHKLSQQQTALKLWRFHNVEVAICPMKWRYDEPWEVKLGRLLDKIDFHHQQGKEISLVGISAGSSAVLQALILRRDSVSKVAIICGKFQYPDNVHPKRYEMNPAFKGALDSSVKALSTLTREDKSKLRCFRPVYDELLSAKESLIPGVRNTIMPTVTHVGGIAYAITIGSWQIVQFLKRN